MPQENSATGSSYPQYNYNLYKDGKPHLLVMFKKKSLTCPIYKSREGVTF